MVGTISRVQGTAKRRSSWAQTLVSEWLGFSLGLAICGLGEPWVQKKPSGEVAAWLTVLLLGQRRRLCRTTGEHTLCGA